MSKPTKLIGTASGKPETALQKLKAAWLRLPEATQDYWREQFSSSRKQSDIRAELAKKLGVKLPHDSKLTKFRSWLDDQDQRDQIAAESEEDRRRFEQLFPNDTPQQIQEKMLVAFQARALTRGDAGLGKFMLRHSLAERRFAASREDAAKASRSDEEKALEYCLEESKTFPEVQEQFKSAFAALKKAKSRGPNSKS